AYSQTSCQAEAESLAGTGSSTTGISPGSTPGTGQPGVSNSTPDDRGRIWNDAYADCVRRQQLNTPQPPTGVSERILMSPQLEERKGRVRGPGRPLSKFRHRGKHRCGPPLDRGAAHRRRCIRTAVRDPSCMLK